jgi:RHS repeat-associated protein
MLNSNPKTLDSAITYLPYGGITGLTYGNVLTLTQGYDNQYRISSIVIGSILNLTYGYDPNGNITSILDSVNPPGGEVLETPGAYSYQQGTNKLTHITGTPSIDFGYDANANITSENNWTYVYDLSNQLIRVLNNSNQVAEYTYNGAGQRIKKVTQTETRIFHYDLRGHLIAETNQTGQMLADYIYLGDQLLAMIKPGESVYYFHNDHLGTPQVLTADSQAIIWKAVYTPFGEAEKQIETVENPFRFPGQYYDSETGLHYNYFRYYNPQTGRYITPDPIGLEGGINLFVYVENNPINFIDPEGLTDRYTICEGKPPGCKEYVDRACNFSLQSALHCCQVDFDYCLMDAGYPNCDEPDMKKCREKLAECQFKARHAGPKKDKEPLKPLPVPDNPPYPGNPKKPYPPY